MTSIKSSNKENEMNWTQLLRGTRTAESL